MGEFANLMQANSTAKAHFDGDPYARELRTLHHDVQGFAAQVVDRYQGLAPIYDDLKARPGMMLRYQLDEGSGLLTQEQWRTSVEIKQRDGKGEHDRPLDVEALTYREYQNAKDLFENLPYAVAAAIRRHARYAGDAEMLKMLDAAKVAVDD
jgi:hypothetical protein